MAYSILKGQPAFLNSLHTTISLCSHPLSAPSHGLLFK